MLNQSKKISKVRRKNPKHLSEDSDTSQEDLLSHFEKKANFLENAIKTIVNENNCCPVNYEEFSLENPPFVIHCGHDISLKSLKKLKTEKVTIGDYETRGKLCPLCRKLFLTASLDSSHLQLLNLSNALAKHNIDENVFKVEQEEFRTKIRKLPQVYSVPGGVLAFTVKKTGKKEIVRNS